MRYVRLLFILKNKIKSMEIINFLITEDQLNQLIHQAKDGKNSDIGKMAIEVVKLYFLSIDPNVEFTIGRKSEPDITVMSHGVSKCYEIKGTQDKDISFSKLKVSSQDCHDKLKNGMEIIRVTNLRNKDIRLVFLKYGIDFILEPEPRWAVKKIKR